MNDFKVPNPKNGRDATADNVRDGRGSREIMPDKTPKVPEPNAKPDQIKKPVKPDSRD